MKEYNGYLENRGRSHAQPNGVSEGDSPSDQEWGHREEMEAVDNEKRKSTSQRVNERRAGKVTRMRGDEEDPGPDASSRNDDKLVDEGKSVKEKYADRYGNDASSSE